MNLNRLLVNAQKHVQPRQHGEPSDLQPVKIVVERLCEGLRPIPGDDTISREAQESSTMLFKALLRPSLETLTGSALFNGDHPRCGESQDAIYDSAPARALLLR